jgi:hypothetical protein
VAAASRAFHEERDEPVENIHLDDPKSAVADLSL